jgi:hypothetical protein
MPTPIPAITTELGSGTEGTPATLIPEVVPNENVTEVMVVSAVIPDPVIENVATSFRNGLCG